MTFFYTNSGIRVNLPKDYDKMGRIYGPAHTSCDNPDCGFDHDEEDELKLLTMSPDTESANQKRRQDVYTGMTSRRIILPILGCSSHESEKFMKITATALTELKRIGYIRSVTNGPRNYWSYKNAFAPYEVQFTKWLFRDIAKYTACETIQEQSDCVEYVRVKALNRYFDKMGDSDGADGEAELQKDMTMGSDYEDSLSLDEDENDDVNVPEVDEEEDDSDGDEEAEAGEEESAGEEQSDEEVQQSAEEVSEGEDMEEE